MNIAEYIKNWSFLDFLIIYFWYGALLKTVIPTGTFITVLVNGILLLMILHKSITSYIKNKKHVGIFLYIVYLLILVSQSSRFDHSLEQLIKFSITILFFPASYFFFKENWIEKFYHLIHLIIILVICFIINIILSNVLGWESMKSYGGDAMFKYGNVFTDGLYTNVIFFVFLPVILSLKNRSNLIIIGFSTLILLLTIAHMKRMPLMIIAICTVLYYTVFKYFSKKKSLKKSNKNSTVSLFKYMLLFAILLMLLYPFFGNIIESQMDVRKGSLEVDVIEEESRYTEFYAVNEEILQFDNISLLLFGKEMFNSVGNYANGKYGYRQIHNDYSLLLHGSGIVGFFSYIAIQFYFLFAFFASLLRNKYKSYIQPQLYIHILCIYIVIWAMGLLTSFSGGIDNIICNSLRYIILGAILSLTSQKQRYPTNYLMQ